MFKSKTYSKNRVTTIEMTSAAPIVSKPDNNSVDAFAYHQNPAVSPTVSYYNNQFLL